MSTFKHIGAVVIATGFALAIAIDAADARRGGGGMRAGGFSGGGMRAGGVGRAGFAGAGARRAHVSNPIARPGIGNRPAGGWAANRPGWGNRPGYGPGYGYRPGYGWGAAAAVGAGVAAATYNSGYYGGEYYGSGYGYPDDGSYAASNVSYAAPSDAVAECGRRFKTYDPVSQTYIRRKGERVSCP